MPIFSVIFTFALAHLFSLSVYALEIFFYSNKLIKFIENFKLIIFLQQYALILLILIPFFIFLLIALFFKQM